jgi:hypothetical protein
MRKTRVKGRQGVNNQEFQKVNVRAANGKKAFDDLPTYSGCLCSQGPYVETVNSNDARIGSTLVPSWNRDDTGASRPRCQDTVMPT